MDTSYCKGTQGSIKPYRNRRAGNCQCCSIPAYVMQARTVTEPYKGLGQGVLVSPSLVLPYLHLKTIFQVYTLSPYFSMPILPFSLPLLLSNAFLISIISLLNYHSFPSWIPSISPPLFTPPPPLHHFIPPLLLQATMLTLLFIPPSLLHTSFQSTISPSSHQSTMSRISFSSSSLHLSYMPLTILHHLLHPDWSHSELLLPSGPKTVGADKHTPLQTRYHPPPLHTHTEKIHVQLVAQVQHVCS